MASSFHNKIVIHTFLYARCTQNVVPFSASFHCGIKVSL